MLDLLSRSSQLFITGSLSGVTVSLASVPEAVTVGILRFYVGR